MGGGQLVYLEVAAEGGDGGGGGGVELREVARATLGAEVACVDITPLGECWGRGRAWFEDQVILLNTRCVGGLRGEGWCAWGGRRWMGSRGMIGGLWGKG